MWTIKFTTRLSQRLHLYLVLCYWVWWWWWVCTNWADPLILLFGACLLLDLGHLCLCQPTNCIAFSVVDKCLLAGQLHSLLSCGQMVHSSKVFFFNIGSFIYQKPENIQNNSKLSRDLEKKSTHEPGKPGHSPVKKVWQPHCWTCLSLRIFKTHNYKTRGLPCRTTAKRPKQKPI